MKCWAKIKSFFRQPEPEAKATEEKAAGVSEKKTGKASEKKA